MININKFENIQNSFYLSSLQLKSTVEGPSLFIILFCFGSHTNILCLTYFFNSLISKLTYIETQIIDIILILIIKWVLYTWYIYILLNYLPGSLRPKHPIGSPVVNGLINSSFCLSFPNLLMGPRYKELFTLIITPAEAQPL